MVYVLADQRCGPYVVGVCGAIAEVMQGAQETHMK